MKNKLDGYVRTCLGIISGSILIIILMVASLFTYIIFFDNNETAQVERRQEHINNHIKEAEKLDEIIKVLEKINLNLDEKKNK